MKPDINPASRSKINITAAVQSLLNIGIYFAVDQGMIPADSTVDALVIANVLGAALIGMFRTWFTVK